MKSIGVENIEFKNEIIDYLNDAFAYSPGCRVLTSDCGLIIYIEDEISLIKFVNEFVDELKGVYSCKVRKILNCNNNSLPKIIKNNIDSKNDIKLYTTHSLILPAIRCNKALENRFYSYFINIFYKNDIPCAWDFTDYKEFYFQLLNETRFTYDSPFDFNKKDIFVKHLVKEYYIFVWIDHYCISVSEFYNKIHDIHPVLIYGYDSVNNKYICKIFSSNKGVYSEYIFSEEVHTAINSAKLYIPKTIDDSQVSFFKTRKFSGNYLFDSPRFIRELYNYINGIGDSEHLYFYFRFMPEITRKGNHYGVNVIKAFAKALINDYKFDHDVDYRVLHLVYEQVNLMYKRLVYLSYEKDLIKEFSEVIDKFRILLENISLIRLLFLKMLLKETNKESVYNMPKDKENIRVLYGKIIDFIKLEKETYDLIFDKIVELLIFSDPKHKALLLPKSNVSTGNDKNGYYYAITLENISEVKSIKIFDVFKEHQNKSLNGKFFFDDGTTVECDGSNALNGILDVVLDTPVTTKCIRFYPDSFYYGVSSLYFGAYTYNLLELAQITVSSTFNECILDYVSKENILIDTQDSCWIPSVDDSCRYIDFVFKSMVELSCVKFRQLADAPRVKRYMIYYFDETENRWNCIIDYKEEIGSHLITNHFNMVKTKKIRLEITETVYDKTGYNVPHVTFFGAFKY